MFFHIELYLYSEKKYVAGGGGLNIIICPKKRIKAKREYKLLKI